MELIESKAVPAAANRFLQGTRSVCSFHRSHVLPVKGRLLEYSQLTALPGSN